MRQYDLEEVLPVVIVNGSLAPLSLLRVSASHRLTAEWPVVASRFLHTALILQIRTDQRGDICLCAHIRDTADAMLDRRGIIVSGYVANL
jgi:hypothetical protein